MAAKWWQRAAATLGLGPSGMRSPENEARQPSYRAILDAIGQPVVVVDRVGRVRAANAAALLEFAYTRNSLEGGPITTLLPEWERLVRLQHSAFRTNPAGLSRSDRPNTSARLADGRSIPVVAAIGRFAQEDGLLIVTLRDVSERVAEQNRQALLREASELLANSVDYEETIRAVAKLATTHLAEWCAVHLREPDGRIRRVVAARAIRDDVQLDRQDVPLDPNLALGVPEVIRTGKPELYHQVPEIVVPVWANSQADASTEHPTSAIIVPLLLRGEARGALSLAALGHRLDTNDLQIAESLASRAALALETAGLIAALREAIAARDESLTHLDTIMRTAPVGLIICNPDCQVADLNVLAAEMLAPDGWPPGQRSGPLGSGLGALIEAEVDQVFRSGKAISGLDVEPPGRTERRHFSLSAYPVQRDGRIVHVGVVLIDTTADHQAKETLQYRLEFEQLLAALSTQFINLPGERIDQGIAESLRSVAEFMDVDAASVVLFADDERGEIAYDWRADGQASDERCIRLADLPWTLVRLRDFEPVAFNHLAEIGSERERQHAAERGIRSRLSVPLIARGQAIGFLSVSTVDRETVWTSLDVAFLRLAAVLIVSALDRKRADSVQRESERLAGIDLAAREMAHLINNDLTGAIGVLELLLDAPDQLERYEPLMRGALQSLLRAADHLRQLQSVARVATKETAVGPALDLPRSVATG
ncbi:MAG: hypothetical protein KatS3mg060_2830 [Dehalococcoidia bacterium]|nr:MAG: hypothetical protein KatS3mg060_2830 [Dehalococcoidia bacterium]